MSGTVDYTDYYDTGQRSGRGGEYEERGRSAEYTERRGGRNRDTTDRSGRGGSGASMKILMQQVEEHGALLDKDMANYVLEDTRLSTLQRKLAKESEPTVALALSLHINDCLLLTENATYVTRSSEIIQDSIIEVMTSKDHTGIVKEMCSIGLGRVGALHSNFSNWGAATWKLMMAADAEQLKALYISAFTEAINQGGGNAEGVEALIGLVKSLLEETQNEVTVVPLLEVMNAVASNHPNLFKDVFTEVVDIAVGWFMESGNIPDVRRAIGSHIIAWSDFWKEEVTFAVDQVGFYIEDLMLETRTGGEDEDLEALDDDEVSLSLIKAFQYKWTSDEYDEEEKEKAATQALAFMQMVDCVLTGLCGANPLSMSLPKCGVWIQLVRDVTVQAVSWRWSEDLAISGLRCLLACYKCLAKCESPSLADKEAVLTDLMSFLAGKIRRLSVAGKRVLILCFNELLGVEQTHLSAMIKGFFGEEGDLVTLAIEASHPCILQDTVNLCHNLMNSKNVLILQEVYMILLEKYEKALITLASVKPFLPSNTCTGNMNKLTAKKIIMFVLAAIGNLATTKSSVLSMWALDPSIFNVLIHSSGLQNACLAVAHPAIHHSILRLLLLHSSAHSYYHSSSSLLGYTTAYPTSTHMENLLKCLTSLITWSACSQTVKSLAIKSLYTILVTVKASAEILISCELFDQIFQAFVRLASSSPNYLKDTLRVFLLLVEDFPLSEEKTRIVAHAVLGSFKYGDESSKQLAMRILAKVPLTSLFLKMDAEVLKKYHIHMNLEKSMLMKTIHKEYNIEDLSSADVKEYFLYVSGDVQSLSWLGFFESIMERADSQIGTELKASCLAWISAQFCVLNKLKSPVGKPQETLGHIDVACRKLSATPAANLNVNQAKGLVRLVEFLEKCMVNAWDGSISGLPGASKSASLFFYANRKTCQDWLERVRGNMMKISFMIGNYHEVVRHAWAMLPVILKKGDLEQPQNIQLMVLTCLALAKLKSPARIQGIYAWAREVSRSKFKWIPGLSEMVRSRTETGIKTLQNFIASFDLQMLLKPSDLTPLLPVLGELIWKGHLHLHENETYFQWMKTYQQETASEESMLTSTPAQNKYLIALSEFQEGMIPTVLEGLESEFISTQEPIIQNILDSVHINLLQAGLQIQKSYMKSNSNWNENSQLTQTMTAANAEISRLMKMNDVTDEDRRLMLVYNAIWQEINCIKNKGTSQVNLLSEFSKSGSASKTLLLVKCWVEFLSRYSKNPLELEGEMTNLNLEICRAARRENNLELSSRHLLQAFSNKFTSLTEYVRTFDIYSIQYSWQKAAILRQACKTLLHLQTSGEESDIAVAAISGLALSASQNLLTLRYVDSMQPLLRESSRAVLNLTRALQSDSNLFERVYPDPKSAHLDAATISQVLQIESVMPTSRETLQKTIPVSKVATENDLVIGRLLRLSILQDPTLPKGWNRLADWAYEMGQRVVESAAKSNHKVELTEDEVTALKSLIPNVSEPSLKKIMGIISQVKLKDSHLAGSEFEKWDFMRRDLREVNALLNVDDETFRRIIALWNSVFSRTYAYYDLAGEAYFKYLSLCGDKPASGTISASLRLLHLTVNHTMELQDIQRGLSTTPSAQWKAIIPQLFSRLNHPVPVVRQRISDLLCRISSRYPELIIFPAVVGSLTTGSQTSQTLTSIFSGSLLNKEEGGTAATEAEGQNNVLMLSAHEKIVEQLKKAMPIAVEQVSSFVSELRRITLLWDELWLGTLAQYNSEVQRRIHRFQQERNRLDSNTSLSEEEKLKLVKEKYTIVFTPIIYVLDQVSNITRVTAETPHEEAFKNKYGNMIEELLERVKNPEDWSKPCNSWSALSQLQNHLNNRVNKKTALKLAEISPSLVALRDTEIMMPGDLGGKEHSVQIARFEGSMVVLPTKTKPKKFSLIGTDGGRYTYLFKGLEDLHLDERIMQFLGIANEMMSKTKMSHEIKYFARNYTVIPLGSRSGLIQWVEGAMPIFTLYKKWQLRQQQHLENAKKSEEASKVVGKPSDIFYAKILPLLRKHGVSKMEDRKSWPISLLKQVLQELMQETPKDLLATELWLRSITGEDWWRVMQNIGRSFAVMSVIGYIIGLGDRHLDNILVNLEKGYVVHIDYNISFEKGKILRIPERVPCRLTQNIVSVFGVSGVEGLFRLGCEHTLSVMRDHRETLLTLLEAFVYDPLVDWTPGLSGGLAGAMYGGGLGQEENEKREMEHSLTFSMLGVRVAEMKGAWVENQHDLEAALLQVEEGLTSWQDLESVSLRYGEKLAALHRNMSNLKEAEVNPSHRLYSILDAYRKQKAVEGGVDVIKTQLEQFIVGADRVLTLYNRAVASLSGPQLSKWDQEVNRYIDTNKTISSSTVSTFLENAGQRELLSQYENVENEIINRMSSLLDEMKRILGDLTLYNTVSSLYPSSGREQHRIHKYSVWGNKLVQFKENFRVEVIDDILSDFTSLFAPQGVAGPEKVEQVRKMNLTLEKEHQENLSTIQKLYQKMMAENLMKPGRSGILEEMSKNRDVMLNQLNHPDSGVRQDTLICFFLNHLVTISTKWMDLDRSLFEEKDVFRSYSILENMFLQASISNTIFNTMELLNLGTRSDHTAVIEAFYHLTSALRELEKNFCTIIFPEGVKKHLQGEVSVIEISRSILNLISSSGLTLEEIKHELRLHTRCVMLGMDSPHMAVIQAVQAMKKNWTTLLSAAAAADNMSTGQMLLCAVNTLLENVDNAMAKLRETVSSCSTAPEFLNLTTVMSAQDISSPAFNNTPGVWDCLILTNFVSKLQLMEQFLISCQTFAAVFNLQSKEQSLPPGAALFGTVKKFTLEFVRGLLLGTGPRHLACAIAHFARENCQAPATKFFGIKKGKVELSDLTQLVYDEKLSSGALNQARIAKSTVLTRNMTNAAHRWALIQQLEAVVEAMNARQQLNSLLHAILQWYHQELLPMNIKLAEPTRHKFLPLINERASRLVAFHAELQNIVKAFVELKAGVDQRLRWAVGANPQLQEVVDQFGSQHAGQIDNIRQAGLLVKTVTGIVEAAVQYELLRTSTPEAQASDHKFLNILSMARESAGLSEMQRTSGLSEDEMSLLDMNPPVETIDKFWIKQTEEVIATTVRSIQDHVTNTNKQCSQALRRLSESASCIKDLLAVHHRLMGDVAVLLRTIMKIENLDFPGISDYLVRYKSYTEMLNALVRTMSADNLSLDLGKLSAESLDRVKKDTTFIYEELVNIAAMTRDETLVQELLKSRKIKDDDPKKDDLESDERSAAKKVEERNKFALNVLKRVRLKLEGREPDTLRKSTVAEQVDFIIREATNHENLALMYEGWTAWI